ncbi:MAG: universal stress protein [Methanocorpusculum sp.]|nr:universal stress protein [Methanocorpusculum sp.]
MFSKILVSVDGSDISIRAFQHALDLAKQNKSELHIIYVIESGLISPGPVDSTWELIYQRFEKEGRELMEKLTAEAKAKNIPTTPHVESGHAGDTIIKTAEAAGCDLIILGSLGKTKLDRLLLGSVSSYVVNYAKTNIMIIRN